MEPVSRLTGHPCKPAHLLVEIVLNRKALKQKRTLVDRFWNLPEWRSQYRQQIISAHSILKLFPLEAVVAALDCRDGNWIYSLSYPKLIELVKREQSRLEHEARILAAIKPIEYNPSNVDAVPKSTHIPTMRDKLRQLDD